MTQRPLPAARSLGIGTIVHPGIASPDRVVLTHGKRGSLVDVRSTRVLAQLPAAPEYVSPRAGAVTLEGMPLRVLRLADNVVVSPKLDGEDALHPSLAASPLHAGVVVQAEATGGAKLAGLLSADFSTGALQRLPFARSVKGFSTVLNAVDWELHASLDDFGSTVGTPAAFPHGADCVRAHFREGGSVACLEYTPAITAPVPLRWMVDGWFGGENPNGQDLYVANAACGAKRFSFGEGAFCQMRATLADPPRALVTCDHDVHAYAWEPGRSYTLTAPADSNDVGGLDGADSGPILPLGAKETASRWLDLVQLREYQTLPLHPLAVDAFAHVEPHALAAANGDIYALDFAKATYEVIAHITDCRGPFEEFTEDQGHASGRWLVLSCMKKPEEGRMATRTLWSEIIDMQTRVRMRTTLRPEVIFDDGLAVLTQQRKIAVESKVPAGRLVVVDLAAAK